MPALFEIALALLKGFASQCFVESEASRSVPQTPEWKRPKQSAGFCQESPKHWY